MHRNFAQILPLIAVLILSASACSPNPSRRKSSDPSTLHIGNGGEPRALDPHAVTGIIEERVLSALFEGLVNYDFAAMQPIPGVAESWDLSEDGTVYTFHLRDDARWSNGDPVTAQDFVYSWRRILEPAFAAEYGYMLYPIENAEAYNLGKITDFARVGVEAPDARTLEVTLRAPTPYFLALQIHFTFYPVHQATIETHGGPFERDTPWTRPGNLVSNGPYTLTEWIPNREIVVTKNARYWDREAIAIDNIAYHPIQNPIIEERSFRAGDLDLTANVPLTKIRIYQRDKPDRIRIDPYIATEFIRFNTTRPPFDDIRVRWALSLAIDRAIIVDKVLRGGQVPATSFVPPGTGGYTLDDAGAVSHDPDRARELLAEAGYPNGEGFPDITMIYDTSENVRIYCEALQNMWKTQLGIHVQLQNFDGKTWLANMIALDYDLARSFWVADYPDPSNFLEMFLANTGNNRTGYKNPNYEALLRDATLTVDPDARNEKYRRAEFLLLSEAPFTPVCYETHPYLIAPRLKGLQSNPLGRISYKTLRLESSSPDATNASGEGLSN